MRRVLALALALAACGGRPPATVAHPQVGPVETTVGGVRVVRAHRATSGHVATGLFVRTREGNGALRATAALVIEARGAGAWRVRATPDGIAVLASAETASLEAALASLARALEVRDATADEVGTALAAVRRRRATRAGDDTATAMRLAIAALGADASPFGDADDDATVTAETVSAWLASVLGEERALVGVVGDVEGEALRGAVASAFGGAPHVLAEDDLPPPWSPSPARVADGSHPVAAVATAAATVDEATRLADWIVRLAPDARAASFPLRGRAVVIATSPGDEGALRTLASAVARARTLDDERTAPATREAGDELLALGDAWLARVGTGGADEGLGVALVRVGDGDADTSTDASLDAVAREAATSEPATDDGTLANGMHVRVARSDGDAVAVSIAWRAGAVLDPPREHGRASLLAAVVARSCEPDADAWWVDAVSFGIVVRGERRSIERTALRAIDCARRASVEVAHTEGLRASAIAEIDFADRVRDWAAEALAPSAPGLVAPDGSADGLAAATDLDDALDAALDPRNATLAIVADEAPERLLAIGSAIGGIVRARSGPTSTARTVAEGDADAFRVDPDLDVPIGIVALRTDEGASELGARSIAHALAEQLAARELPVRAWLGSAGASSSFAIVAVTGTDERLDALPSHARAAIAAVTVPESLGADDAAAARDRALARAAPEALARSLAAPSSPAAAPDVARALLRSSPHFVLVRPTAASVRRTR